MYNTVTRSSNEYLKTYFDECSSIIDGEKEETDKNMILLIYFLENMIIVNGMKKKMMKMMKKMTKKMTKKKRKNLLI